MKNKEEMINAIYEKIADKTLSEGCKIELTKHYYEVKYDEDGRLEEIKGDLDYYGYNKTKFYYNHSVTKNTKILGVEKSNGGIISKYPKYLLNNEFHYQYYYLEDRADYKDFYDEQIYCYISKIIGHTVMIGDVLDLILNDVRYISGTLVQRRNISHFVLKIWKEQRKPIEEQSDKCIEYVYDLIK